MRAIILAAGRGSRLGLLTGDKPKCLVELGGMSLLERQLEALREVTDDIVIVRGYAAARISARGVRYVDNADYASRNTVDSLMKARELFEGDCLVCYSDLVYEPRLLRVLAASRRSIGVGVDVDFREYWEARFGTVFEDSESLRVAADDRITRLGDTVRSADDLDGRFVGLLRFDDVGTQALTDVYDRHASAAVDGRPWYSATGFHTAAMTDLLQAAIDAGVRVSAVPISRGWIEVDSSEDHTRYEQWISDGSMSRFCAAFTPDEGGQR
jgi:choline kinase